MKNYKEKFKKFLEEKNEEGKVNLEERKQFFIKKVNELYSIIDKYLEPFKDKMEIKDEKMTIYEEELGSYKVKKRTMKIKNRIVELIPIGTFIIGAFGRVDMEGPYGKVIFVLVPKDKYGLEISIETFSEFEKEKIEDYLERQEKEKEKIKEKEKVWKISTFPPCIRYLDLNEDIFFEKLMEIVDG